MKDNNRTRLDIYFGKGVTKDMTVEFLEEHISQDMSKKEEFYNEVVELRKDLYLEGFEEIYSESSSSLESTLLFTDGTIIHEVIFHLVDIASDALEGFAFYLHLNKEPWFEDDIEMATYMLGAFLS